MLPTSQTAVVKQQYRLQNVYLLGLGLDCKVDDFPPKLGGNRWMQLQDP